MVFGEFLSINNGDSSTGVTKRQEGEIKIKYFNLGLCAFVIISLMLYFSSYGIPIVFWNLNI